MTMYKKIKQVFQEKRLPWFISNRIEKLKNTLYFVKNNLSYVFNTPSHDDNKLISYVCGFHGGTGGAFAAASIANILASRYRVEFVTYFTSDINRLLSKKVKLVLQANLKSDLFICDAECEHSFYQQLKSLNKKLIISCHCLPEQSHGLEPDYIIKSLTYADCVHFVSAIQQEAFQLSNAQCRVIPNTSKKINKTILTNNVGSVGNLSDVRKNANESIKIALASKASAIHLWSVKQDIWQNNRVITHHWETDKNKIYNSFDVLVFMSELETFGLVVIEAMSAGIPCMLSAIPVFKQFEKCPGIVIIDAENKQQAGDILNTLLTDKAELSQKLRNYFDDNYSEMAIFKQWNALVVHVMKQKN